jgi:hypothetical protein
MIQVDTSNARKTEGFMNKIARFRRFVRIGGVAAIFSLSLAACNLTTAPPFPESDTEEKENKDPNDG